MKVAQTGSFFFVNLVLFLNMFQLKKMNYTTIFSFVFMMLLSMNVYTQDTQPVNPFLDFEMSVQKMFYRMIQTEDDDIKEVINDTIRNHFIDFLDKKGSFEHEFDSLKSIGAVMSDDNELKIYTWNLPYFDGTHGFYGFIQIRPDDKEPTITVELQHNNERIPNFENAIITASNWYGALYYDIINTKHKGETYYTLLAYDPHDIFTKRKIIDVLNIREGNMLSFGRAIFQKQNRSLHRVVFEYSARVGMMLRFNDSMEMIIYDHLSPSSPAYEGRYQYYGPDFSYDGFEFDDGLWIHQEDIRIEY